MVVFLVVLVSMGYSHDQLNFSNKALAEGQHLVSVFVDGKKRSVPVSAKTVGEAVAQLGIKLDQGDVTEPSLDSPLDQPVFYINVYRGVPAVVEDEGKQIQVVTGYRSAREIAAAAGTKLYPEDRAELSQVDDFIANRSLGNKVVVHRAKPVQVIVAGKTYNCRTFKNTVGELLAERGIEYNPKDIMNVKSETKLEKGQRIILTKITQNVVAATEEIAPPVQIVLDPNKLSGQESVEKAGQPGTKQVSYLVSTKDGVESERKILEEKVIKEPVARVVVRGAKVAARINSSAATDDGWAKLRFCEAGGDYSRNSGNGYYGAYQFDISTWGGYGGYARADLAPPAVQDAKALETYARRGASPWPVCGRYL